MAGSNPIDPKTSDSETKSSLSGKRPVGGAMSADQKELLERENRKALDEDILHERLAFESTPYKVQLVLSNFCNMSCTMCYDGENPRVQKLAPELIEGVADSLLSRASVLIPFETSEPLVLTWDTTLELAQRYHLELDLVTNLQFLDEAKFRELEPHVKTITFSFDTHIPEIYEKIRLRAKTDLVFKNLETAARLCKEHGIMVMVNVVFMTENAAWLPDTVAYLADLDIPIVHVLQYVHMRGERKFSDPLMWFKPEYVEHIRERCRAVAEAKEMCLGWEVDGNHWWDYRPLAEIDPKNAKEADLTDCEPRRDGNHRKAKARDLWPYLLARYVPGFCHQSARQVKINHDGRVYPCCKGSGDELVLGDLNENSELEIWNGTNAQDLRRAMFEGDYPRYCQNCVFREAYLLKQPPTKLPFTKEIHERLGHVVKNMTLEAEGPEHLARLTEPPVIRWDGAGHEVDEFWVVLALGGELLGLQVFEVENTATEFQISREVFDQLKDNFAYWWSVWGVNRSDPAKTVRCQSLRAFFRHAPRPRLEGSTLRY